MIDTAFPGWRTLAGRLEPASPDVLLLARRDSDLSDLLEAMSLHMDLIGFGGTAAGSAEVLQDKIHGVLMRRAVKRAQEGLAKALEKFREAVKNT